MEGKTGASEQKLPGAKKRTNNTPRVDPGPHWREASAVTIAPPLLPQSGIKGLNRRARSLWKDVSMVKHTVSPANRTQW